MIRFMLSLGEVRVRIKVGVRFSLRSLIGNCSYSNRPTLCLFKQDGLWFFEYIEEVS